MKPAKARACGKYILMGEHFVIPPQTGETGGLEIAAVPALAFPLMGLWCEVKVRANHHQHYNAQMPDLTDRETVESLMARATYAAANSLRIDISAQPLNVESVANFPVSRGFGSSAAFAVALVRALDEYRKQLINQSADWDELVRATVAVEKIFHGRPSGLDTAVILAQRPIRFENGTVAREVTNHAADFVLIDSGSRDQCSTLVQEVVAFRKREPQQWANMAQALRGLVDDCEAGLSSGDASAVARSVRGAHGILAELGLSNPGIEDLLGKAVELGALAGKVSGAGGGGAVVLVARRGEGTALAEKLKDSGAKVVGVDLASAEDQTRSKK